MKRLAAGLAALLFGAFTLVVALPGQAHASGGPGVNFTDSQWAVLSVNLISTVACSTNCYTDQSVTGTFTPPSGSGASTITQTGFLTSAGTPPTTPQTWTIRFTPTVTGTWTYSTSPGTSDSGLTQSGSITVSAPTSDAHGFLRSINRGFEFDDGTPYFMLGQTYYGLAEEEEFAPSAAHTTILNAAASGITKLRVLAFPWPVASQNAAPFSDSNQQHVKLDQTYLAALDSVIQDAASNGLQIDLELFADNDNAFYCSTGSCCAPYPACGGTPWPGINSVDDNYVKYMVARYAAYPNVEFVLSNEFNNTPYPSTSVGGYFDHIGHVVESSDPYFASTTLAGADRPLSIHPTTNSPPLSGGTIKFSPPSNYPWQTEASFQFHQAACSSYPGSSGNTVVESDALTSNPILNSTNQSADLPLVSDESSYLTENRDGSPCSAPEANNDVSIRWGIWAAAASGGYSTIGDSSHPNASSWDANTGLSVGTITASWPTSHSADMAVATFKDGGGGSDDMAMVKNPGANTSSTTSIALALSTAPAAGDLVVAYLSGFQNGWSAGLPSGWSIAASDDVQTDVAIAYHVAAAGDPSSYTFTEAGPAGAKEGRIEEWTGFSGTPVVDLSAGNTETSHSSLTVTPSPNTTANDNEIVLAALSVGGGGGTATISSSSSANCTNGETTGCLPAFTTTTPVNGFSAAYAVSTATNPAWLTGDWENGPVQGSMYTATKNLTSFYTSSSRDIPFSQMTEDTADTNTFLREYASSLAGQAYVAYSAVSGPIGLTLPSGDEFDVSAYNVTTGVDVPIPGVTNPVMGTGSQISFKEPSGMGSVGDWVAYARSDQNFTGNCPFGCVPVKTVTLPSDGDAFVRDGTYTTTNFGSQTNLESKTGQASGYNRQFIVRFNVSGLSSVSTATLFLYGGSSGSSGCDSSTAYQISGSWTESTIDWTNQPTKGSAIAGPDTTVCSTQGWYTWNITPWVQSQLAAGQTEVSVLILQDGPPSNIKPDEFNSREASSDQPQLVVSGSE